MKKKNIEKKVTWKVLALSVLSVLGASLLIVAVLLYGFGKRGTFIDKISNYLPYPAAMIEWGSFVAIGDVNSDLTSIKKFYESQNFSDVGLRVDFATEDGQKRLRVKEKNLLNKLIENKIIEKIARSKGIVITKEMASQNVQREVEQYGNGSEVEKNLANLYNWNMDDFKEKIVKPDMYRDELDKNRKATDESFVEAKERILQVQKELNDKGEFAEVAKKYSEGESAKNGGDLGWFTADQMMPEIAMSVFMMKEGERSDVVESSIGFHIIQIDDRKTEDGIDKIKVRQILIRAKSFSDWLLEQEKNMRVRVFLKDYYWNNDMAVVEFKDQAMQDFENDLERNSSGDASVLF